MIWLNLRAHFFSLSLFFFFCISFVVVIVFLVCTLLQLHKISHIDYISMANVVCATIRQQFNQAICVVVCCIIRFCISFANHRTRTTSSLPLKLKYDIAKSRKQQQQQPKTNALHFVPNRNVCARF